MPTKSGLGLFLVVLFLCTLQISARQYHVPIIPGDGKIHLDVVVTSEAGLPVTGLEQQDFTVFDNRVQQTIFSFQAFRERETPTEVVLVVDNLNTSFLNKAFERMAFERWEIDKFLRTDGGQLAHPTALAFLTDAGIKVENDFSSDGNALSAALDRHTRALPTLHRQGGFYSRIERLQVSIHALFELGTREAARPGRKIILWISPGWPASGDREQMDAKQEQTTFNDVVTLSTLLRQGRITMYSIGDSSGWEPFFKGITKPSQTVWADLALQVIATQSGGLALSAGNDITTPLKRCLADTHAYYEISFDPATTDQPNEYHDLEIRIAKPGLTARTRQGYYSQPRLAEKVTAESEKLGEVEGDTLSLEPGAGSVTPEALSEQVYYANAHPYIDLPLAQLVDRIPELKAVQPAADQQELPGILQKMGMNVDNFVRDIGDLIANEDVTQEKLNAKGSIQAKEQVQDNYLILQHGHEWGASSEYRMDKKGNRLGPIGLEKGYVVTAGYALSCVRFSTVAQPQSRFRYLGEEKIGSRDTYVMGFAQKPGETTFFNAVRGAGGAYVNMLTQGILWVDKNSFQIIRMRSDLLAPRNEIRLDQLTTEVAFGEVQLQDVPNPLWLPRDVDVSMEIEKQKFRNLHHYTDYRRYRVSVKIGSPQ
jgi:VWFA-related protein